MLRIMLPFAVAGLLRKPIATANVRSSIRILYVFIVVVDVDVAVCPSTVVTPTRCAVLWITGFQLRKATRRLVIVSRFACRLPVRLS